MATLDVLTVYQSWKGFQLFDEVMVQMHRYQFLKSWQWMSTVVRELQFSVIVFQKPTHPISPPNFTIHASKVPFHANFMLLNDLQNERQFPTKFLNMG